MVGTDIRGEMSILSAEDSLEELARLADTAGLEIVGAALQRLDQPHTSTYIGQGKVQEVKAMVLELDASVIIFDDELQPRQQRSLEKEFGDEEIKVLDRTALILDIFAQHAQTREGKLQVELAQLEYRIPRLTRMWTHLARQAGTGGGAGGSVGLRGPGETQLEMDRRMINRRVAHIKGELDAVMAHRTRHRSKRQQTALQTVAIVGYTNAGKSTLLNRLSNANVLSADMLFATLDPTTRRVRMPGGRDVLFTDTVGFIQKLPTDIVAAFRATLEEIIEADILLHVIDATHPNVDAQIESVLDTLSELEVEHYPMVYAFNKIDALPEGMSVGDLPQVDSWAVNVSAHTGAGIEDLRQAVFKAVQSTYTTIEIKLPYDRGDLVNLFHERGFVDLESYEEDHVAMQGRIPPRLTSYFKQFTEEGEYWAEI
ncbi:MAG: GTPase HflX [Chloroflexota bacterium]